MIISREEYENLNNLVDAQRDLINALKKQVAALEKHNQILTDLNHLLKELNQKLKNARSDEKGVDENPLKGIEPKSIPTKKHTFKYQRSNK